MQDTIYKEALKGECTSRLPVDTDMGFDTFTRAYAFTNEGLTELLKTVPHKKKKILGITASGDHAICALAEGCSEFIGVDVSVFASLFAELKFAALKKLDYSSFTEFFSIPDELKREYVQTTFPSKFSGSPWKAFSRTTYEKVRDGLSTTARDFFDNVIGYSMDSQNHHTPFALNYLVNRLNQDEMRSIPYLNTEEAYNQSQRILHDKKTPLFVQLDIKKPDLMLNRKFDIIYLSNVLEYSEDDPSEYSKKEIKATLGGLSNLLAPEGVIIGCSISDSLEMIGDEFRTHKIHSAELVDDGNRTYIPTAVVISQVL